MEAEATFTVQQVAATAFMLYLCMFALLHRCRLDVGMANLGNAAPFAVDMISRIF